MKHCIICWQQCKTWAKYCYSCWKLLRYNWTRAANLKKKLWSKLCPICFKPINEHDTFCGGCNTTLHRRKQTFNSLYNEMSNKDILELEYTYIIKDPHFYRKNKKDYVDYKIIELWLKTGYKFSQNLELLYKEWLPKRNRFQWKEKYFEEYLVPIIRKQYERWRLNQIWFWVDVAVETILNGKKIEDDWQKAQ
mgnify:CR=1 FL=1